MEIGDWGTFVALRLRVSVFLPARATQGARRHCSVVMLGEEYSRWRRERMPGNAGLARHPLPSFSVVVLGEDYSRWRTGTDASVRPLAGRVERGGGRVRCMIGGN